jgi:hypothetical protein
MKKVLLALSAVLLLGLVLRIGFASLVVQSHGPVSFADIHGDTGGYIQLGERMSERKSYTAGTKNHRNRGLVRPPGYPAFYSVTRAIYLLMDIDLRADLRPIIWPQVVLSLGQVAATFFIMLRAVRNLWFACLGGAMAALSPTAIGCAAIALPDSLFGATFALAFLGLLIAMRPVPDWKQDVAHADASTNPTADRTARIRRKTANRVSLAGLSLAIATLLKPAAVYWPILGVPILLLARGINRGSLGDVRRLFLPMVIAVAMWTTYNGLAENVWVFSTVSERNMRYGVVPAVEAAAKLKRLPTQAEYGRRAWVAINRDRNHILREGLPDELHDRITSETSAVVRAHPIWTARVLISNLRTQLCGRYKAIHRQLTDPHLPVAASIRGWVVDTGAPWAVTAWYGLMLMSLPLCWLARDHCDWRVLALCWIGFTYIALPTGTVGSEGTRLLLAGEPMAITLIVSSLAMGFGLVRKYLARRKPAVSPTP